MFPELISDLLQDGYKVSFSAPGHSMYPTIMANETVLVKPIDCAAVRKGDIILYRDSGRLIAHRVVGINFHAGNVYSTHPASVTQSSILRLHHCFSLRGDASQSCDEPVKDEQILGKVISIERNGRSINPYSLAHRITCLAFNWASRIKGMLN